jgi:hypothetical protein
MNSKDPINRKMCKQAREAHRGGSRRRPHSRSSQPVVHGSGLPTGAACEVLAPAEKLASGAEARGLARCDGLRRHRGRRTRASGPSSSSTASWVTRRRLIRRLLCAMVGSSSAPLTATSGAARATAGPYLSRRGMDARMASCSAVLSRMSVRTH